MGMLSVLIAAAASFAFGAVWYISLSKPWMAAADVACDDDGKPTENGGVLPFIIGGVCMILVAGMMRHIFAMAGIDGFGKGLVAGLGVGLFFITPWVAMNYAYSMRPKNLTLIDGGYSIIGPAIIGAVLGLF